MLWTVDWSGAWMSSDGFQFEVVTVYGLSWLCTIYLPTVVDYVHVIRCHQSGFNIYWGTNAYIHVFACHITKLVLVIYMTWLGKQTYCFRWQCIFRIPNIVIWSRDCACLLCNFENVHTFSEFRTCVMQFWNCAYMFICKLVCMEHTQTNCTFHVNKINSIINRVGTMWSSK